MSDNQPAIPNSKSKFLENLVKLIPAEIIALYAVVSSFVPEALVAQLFVAIPLAALTPFYLRYAMDVKKISQVVISTIAFVVWLFAIGGPFVYFDWYTPGMGGALLALYTLIPPIIYGKRLSGYEGTTSTRSSTWREVK